MKLDYPFIQLPVKFDADRLLKEVSTIEDSAWQPHPQGYAGNDALTLITPYGINNNDDLSGPMLPTDYLKRCPYLLEVLQCIGGVWGRTRLMKLLGQAEVTAHIDADYYWRERSRVHVPIITQKSVRFYCGDDDVHMQAGECWIFDTWRLHNVINDATEARIHLVADTIGSEVYWDLVRNGRPHGVNIPDWQAQEYYSFNHPLSPLRLETQNMPDVMTPWEMSEHFKFLFSEAVPNPDLRACYELTLSMCLSWRALWTEYGNHEDAFTLYVSLRDNYKIEMRKYEHLRLRNGYRLDKAISSGVMNYCVKGTKQKFEEHRFTGKENVADVSFIGDEIVKSLIIVSSPRSGSTMFFEALEKNSDLCSIGGESHGLIESIEALHPISQNYDSNVLTDKHCSQEISQELYARFYQHAVKPDGSKPKPGEPMRLLEKTPKNALRIPFMKHLFPDAQFVYLYRDPKQVISSMIDAWQSGRFITYPNLPSWTELPWSLLLIPGWRELIGKPLHYVVANQWATTTRIMLDDLQTLDQNQIIKVRYEDLLLNTNTELNRVCTYAGIRKFENIQELALSKHTLTPPDPNKWQRNEQLIEEIWPIVELQVQRAERYMAQII